ncbi:MAG: sulfatase [Rikenellaceae bacterium]
MKNLPLLLLGGATLASGAVAAAETEQPNVVILFVDDLGWADLGYNNPKFETPNIDQLQKDGMYFRRAYVSTATSSPSRSSLITGKEALRCGFTRHIYGPDSDKVGHPGNGEFELLAADPGQLYSRAYLQDHEITYAERLKENGYYTYFAGKWHLGENDRGPATQGFDEVWASNSYGSPSNYIAPFFKTENFFPDVTPGEGYLTNMITDGVVDFVKNYDKPEPFLLNYWYYNVHSPHIGRPDLVEKYLKAGLSKTDAIYAAQVTSVDESVGRIRKAIADKGLADNTIFIFTSDQGGAYQNAHLRGGKIGGDTLGEGGSRVSMIVYAPGMEGMGTTFESPVQTLDIYPTIVEMASGKKCKDKQIQGVSLVSVLDGGKLKDRDLFMHRSYEDQNSVIMNGDWKLIRYRSGKVQLYNLKDDESETTDLSKSNPKMADAMFKRLVKWQLEATPKEIISTVPVGETR